MIWHIFSKKKLAEIKVPLKKHTTLQLVMHKAKLQLLKLIQIFARAVLVMKKLEIKETKTT